MAASHLSKLSLAGRVGELEALKRFNEAQMPGPIFIYGPEGCGKSRLFLEAVRRFGEWFDDGLAVYVNASEAMDPRGIFYIAAGSGVRATGDPRGLVANAIEAVMEYLGIPVSSLTGEAVALSITAILGKLCLRLRGAQRIFLVIDELARNIKPGGLNSYAKSLYNEMIFRREGEPLYGKILNIFVLTSKDLLRDALSRHSYAAQMHIWNLPRSDFEELYHRLREIYSSSEAQEAPSSDEVWRLYGGNPRRLFELAAMHRWNVKAHLAMIRDEKKISRIVHIAREKGFLEILRAVVEDPDNIYRLSGTLRLARILERENLIIEMPSGEGLGGIEIPRDRGLGIGRDWAWQIPVYRVLLAERIREIKS